MSTLTSAPEKPPRNIWGVHPNVFWLGLTSLFTDVSSEMIFTIMPLFVVNVLGNGALAVGAIGGLTESFDAFFRIFAGRISDKLKKRKLLAVLGYGFSTIVKPFMYIATSWGGALAVRLGDRAGKGVRSSPRDALVADSVTKEQRGKCFGLHRAMDTAGATLGLAAAAVIIYYLQGRDLKLELHTYRWLVLGGIIPAVIAVVILLLFVHEKKQPAATAQTGAATLKKTLHKPKPSRAKSADSFFLPIGSRRRAPNTRCAAVRSCKPWPWRQRLLTRRKAIQVRSPRGSPSASKDKRWQEFRPHAWMKRKTISPIALPDLKKAVRVSKRRALGLRGAR